VDKDKALNLALDAASKAVHMMLLREGSSWGVKACEEMGLVFMNAYHKELPASEWVGLTDEELRQCIGIGTEDSDWNVAVVQEWLRKVEAKLKEKNNG